MHAALTALGGNLLCNSEDKRVNVAPEQQIKTNCETSVGRGGYTSGRWGKSLSYSVPLMYPGQKLLFKIVLLVEVPGDLSDHGVGVAHKAAAVLQKKRNIRIYSCLWTKARILR